MGASHMEELGIVIKADGTVELADGMKLSADQTSKLGQQIDQLGQKLQAAEKGQKAVTASTKEMGKEMGQAGEKAVQVGKDLANGQWKQVAADMAQTAIQGRVLTGAMVAGGVAVGTIAAGLGVLAYAAYQGAKAERELNDQLTLTGNFAGLVTGQLDTMAGSVARNINGNVGHSREVLAGLVSTGKFTVQSLAEVGTAAQLLQRYTGESSAQVVRHFAGMEDGVAKWAQKANDSYHFLSFEQFKHIKLLEEQGRKQDAMRETSEALSRHLGGDLTQNLGTLQKAWQGVTNWAARAWDAMLGLGRTETTQEKIEGLSRRIDVIRNSSKGRYTPEQKDQLIGMLEGERSALQSDSRQDRMLASNRSSREQAAQAAIDDSMKKPRRGPREDNVAENYIAQLERQLRGASGETSTYADVLEHLKINVDKFTLSQGYAALAIAETIDKKKQQKMVDAAELKYLQESFEAREKDTNAWLDYQAAQRESLRDREFEISLLGKTAEQVARLTMAYTLQKAARSSATAVMASREKGVISPEDEQRRLREIERNTAAEMAQRNTQLADQFKPGWQRMIEGWGDSMQMMKDAHGNAMSSIVQGGEEMWVQFVRTGKLSARSMVDGVISEMARLYYRQNFAGPLASAANGFLGSIFGNLFGGGGSGFGTGAAFGNQDLGLFLHGGGVAGGPPTFTRSVDPGVFHNAPRFHSGGVAGDEVPIITKKGEGIFTKEQMANLQPAGGGTQVTFAPTINIDARTDRGEVYELVSRAVRAGQADLLDQLERGTA